ncbi:phytanoyl-CoA dioxygenase family protein [Mucilaginibacter sp. PAMB04168]|uniref:phytanoyl-CoA dioxygenase family protein n=1 Tax=Mucilaginibacter sp. PAMB04168 TaxID=3138567 RepID=UPI0031F63DE2
MNDAPTDIDTTTIYIDEIATKGYTIVHSVFSHEEIDFMHKALSSADTSRLTFRKSADLFAIRQFLKELPEIKSLIFTRSFEQLLTSIFGDSYFVVKSIYFDKPEDSNWFVAYHQDLTISVKSRQDIAGFGPWTVKQDQFAVQPPLEILQQNFTVRIHLDNTDEHNGALRVVPGSHRKGIYRPETIDWSKETEEVCPVSKGGIMVMRPLLLHSSSRTTSKHRRRVIHIEFSNVSLPEPLKWSEIS